MVTVESLAAVEPLDEMLSRFGSQRPTSQTVEVAGIATKLALMNLNTVIANLGRSSQPLVTW
jgi:hypothetical protein